MVEFNNLRYINLISNFNLVSFITANRGEVCFDRIVNIMVDTSSYVNDTAI